MEETVKPWPRVAVVGPGGVGSYFGGMLARAGAPVTMLGRPGRESPHLVAMARHGLRLATVTFDEWVSVETATSADAVSTAELVLFCVKTPDTDAAAGIIAPHVSEETLRRSARSCRTTLLGPMSAARRRTRWGRLATSGRRPPWQTEPVTAGRHRGSDPRRFGATYVWPGERSPGFAH